MKKNILMTIACLLPILAACSAGDEALKEITNDPAYRNDVKNAAQEGAFKDKTADEAFEAARDTDTHAQYVAFLEIYPESAHGAEVEELLTRFKVFSTKETRQLESETLEEMCWPEAGRIFQWRQGGTAGSIVMGGSPALFGPIMLWSETGSIQLISGSYSNKNGGVEVGAGTRIIYSTKCHGS